MGHEVRQVAHGVVHMDVAAAHPAGCGTRVPGPAPGARRCRWTSVSAGEEWAEANLRS